MKARIPCALGKVQIPTMDAEQVKRDGWVEQGILVVKVGDDRLDTLQQAAIISIGNTLYGKRNPA